MVIERISRANKKRAQLITRLFALNDPPKDINWPYKDHRGQGDSGVPSKR